MKRLLTILFLCCCISMYGQNNGQYNNTQYPKNNGSTTTKSKNRKMSKEEKDSINNSNNKKIKAQILEHFREMTYEEAEKLANQFNAYLDEAGISGYRFCPEEILKMMKTIGYIDLRPRQNYIDKRIDKQIDKRKKIEQWIKDAEDSNKQLHELFKNINPKDSKDDINRQKQTLLKANPDLEAKYKDVKKRGKELGVSSITQAENALKNSLTEQKKLENLKTQLINACVGNCLTK